MRSPVPDEFARNVRETEGEVGVAWLARLPTLLDACVRRWSLTILPPFAGLSYHYVAPVIRQDGSSAVLKVGTVPRSLEREANALRFFDDHGMTRLLDDDPDLGALLLERLSPGEPLLTVTDDEAATRIAASVMRQLWRPAPVGAPFPSVVEWAADLAAMRAHFDGGTGPFPARLVDLAERLFAVLIPSMAAPVLLHGDLHHTNILRAEREPWLAIDPKGVLGEPAYETGAFLRNPLPELLEAPNPARMLTRRVDVFVEMLGLDRERVVGWAVAQAMLSAWWKLEDHGAGWEPAVACAELFAGMLP